jgi:hypothetical protein
VEMWKLLAAVFETIAAHWGVECKVAKHCAVVVREMRRVKTGGYIGQPHKCSLFCMGPTGSDPAAFI